MEDTYEIVRPPVVRSFLLPTREELLAVKKGDHVKLIFRVADKTPERMWVNVTHASRTGDDLWQGTLDNDPNGLELYKAISYGATVVFHPLDVINIIKAD